MVTARVTTARDVLARLHAAGRDRPHALLEIDLIPARTERLARSRRGEDDELESACARRCIGAQLRHQRADLAVGHRRMMRDPTNLSLGGEQLVEVAAPYRRIFALAVAAHLGPVQTRSMRWRTREAVSGFSFQIGSSTFRTRAVSTACTGSAPITG